MEQAVHQKGDPLLLKCVTQEIPCRIEKIYEKFDPTSIKLTEEDASSLQNAEVADVLIQLDGKAVVDLFNEIPEMGRFVLEKDGTPWPAESFRSGITVIPSPRWPLQSNPPSIGRHLRSNGCLGLHLRVFLRMGDSFIFFLNHFCKQIYSNSNRSWIPMRVIL